MTEMMMDCFQYLVSIDTEAIMTTEEQVFIPPTIENTQSVQKIILVLDKFKTPVFSHRSGVFK